MGDDGMQRVKVVVQGTNRVFPFVYFYGGARFFVEQAEACEEGRLYNCMAAIISSAFCIEAFLNHVGSKVLPYWDDKVKMDLGPESKLKVICHHLGLQVDHSRPPFQSFGKIFKFRNKVAHAVTETVAYSGVASLDAWWRSGEAWWQKQCKPRTARRLLDDTVSMVRAIGRAAELGDYPFMVFEDSIGGGRVLSDDQGGLGVGGRRSATNI